MKRVRIKSALPLFGAAAIWLLFGLITPIYKLWAIILTAAVSVGGYFILSKLFPGRETEVRVSTGDAEIDRQIAEGRALLMSIKASNDAIPDYDMSARIKRMEDAGEAIFKALEADTSRAAQVRRFMNYYLPTADKLLTTYRALTERGGSGENVVSSIKSIDNSMEMIAVAFEKQLDALYKDKALDIETDIEVLDTIIKSEGHSQEGATLGGV